MVGILATITTGTAIVMFPVPAILLDVVVVSFIIAGLRDEIIDYVNWRSACDPSYKLIKEELFKAEQ